MKSFIIESNLKIKNISDKLEYERGNFEEKVQILDDSKQQLKLEFENLSNKILEQNLKKTNVNLSNVLNPLKEQIQTFGNRVNEIYSDEKHKKRSRNTFWDNVPAELVVDVVVNTLFFYSYFVAIK